MSLGILKKFNFFDSEVYETHDIPGNIVCSLVLSNWSIVYGCGDGTIVCIGHSGLVEWAVRKFKYSIYIEFCVLTVNLSFSATIVNILCVGVEL